ncbi:20S proteasome subunit A/B, partial [Synechococcus sp. CS-1333]|nr:20S proteasome subunit A/B [Synechococcus sp. CS-1333]
MYVFQPASDRLFVLLGAGNLATTQAVVNHIQRDLDQEIASQASAGEDLRSCHYLFEAANYIGAVSVAVQEKH